MSCSTASEQPLDVASLFASLVPSLQSEHTKGQHGRVAIIGGSAAFTGAPYYAGGAALHMGVDLLSVYCPPSAAGPIKGYSPELMVKPLLVSHSSLVAESRAQDVLVVGPGLGAYSADTHDAIVDTLKSRLCAADESWLVFDAEGITVCLERVFSALDSSLPFSPPSSSSTIASGGAHRRFCDLPGWPASASAVILTPNDREFCKLAALPSVLGRTLEHEKEAVTMQTLARWYTLPGVDADAAATADADVNADTDAVVDPGTSAGACCVRVLGAPRPRLLPTTVPNLYWAREYDPSAGPDPASAEANPTVLVARAMGGVTVARKSACDLITNGAFTIVNLGGSAAPGLPPSPAHAQLLAHVAANTRQPAPLLPPHKRCGGLGDLFAGACGATLAWARARVSRPALAAIEAQAACAKASRESDSSHSTWSDSSAGSSGLFMSPAPAFKGIPAPVLAAALASVSVRGAARRALADKGRRMTAADALERLALPPGVDAELEGLISRGEV